MSRTLNRWLIMSTKTMNDTVKDILSDARLKHESALGKTERAIAEAEKELAELQADRVRLIQRLTDIQKEMEQ